MKTQRIGYRVILAALWLALGPLLSGFAVAPYGARQAVAPYGACQAVAPYGACQAVAPHGAMAGPALAPVGLQKGGTEPSHGLAMHRMVHGLASWYGLRHHGRLTANGERFDMFALTAAHRTLRFGTLVRVTNLRNGKTVVVRINDRGPALRLSERVIDLSWAAALCLDYVRQGLTPVRLEIITNVCTGKHD